MEDLLSNLREIGYEINHFHYIPQRNDLYNLAQSVGRHTGTIVFF